MYPDDVKYTESHEWVRVVDGLATIGITDYAQEELGDIVNVELPEPGTVVRAHEAFGSVDSVKAVSDLLSPVTGEVVEVNEDLEGSPELINQEPYGTGWLIIVRMDDTSELNELMDSEAYERFVEAE
ncbi:MAG TPA: glycine cleavage system protein GcvH [Armatimonadota bacterium]|nr:glycine cleavage system protein GcvH [Armatimonadota bacterium]